MIDCFIALRLIEQMDNRLFLNNVFKTNKRVVFNWFIPWSERNLVILLLGRLSLVHEYVLHVAGYLQAASGYGPQWIRESNLVIPLLGWLSLVHEDVLHVAEYLQAAPWHGP
jgi:hypothetical protein